MKCEILTFCGLLPDVKKNPEPPDPCGLLLDGKAKEPPNPCGLLPNEKKEGESSSSSESISNVSCPKSELTKPVLVLGPLGCPGVVKGVKPFMPGKLPIPEKSKWPGKFAGTP